MQARSPDPDIQTPANNVSFDHVLEEIKHRAGETPQIELAYEPQIKTLWLTLAPEPRPVFTLKMMASIGKVQRAIHSLWGPGSATPSPVRFLVYAHKDTGTVFTLGGDLDYYLKCIAANDRAGLEEYARTSIESIRWNVSCLYGTAITLSNVRAMALGGGIDAPRSANIMIAERQATFSYPEVKFNHFPIAAMAVLSFNVGARGAHQILSSGAEYTADDFLKLGVLDAVVEQGQGDAWIRKYSSEGTKTFPARLALFCALHARVATSFEQELSYLAEIWTDRMIQMTPMECAYLRKILSAQDSMLSRALSTPAMPRKPD